MHRHLTRALVACAALAGCDGAVTQERAPDPGGRLADRAPSPPADAPKIQLLDVVKNGNSTCNQMVAGNGVVLHNAKVQNIFWGTPWRDNASDASLRASVDGAWSNLGNNPSFYSELVQYGVGNGSYLGNVLLTFGNPPAQVYDRDVQGMIDFMITQHQVPPPDDNMLYVAYLPSGTTSHPDLEKGWGGHHDSFIASTGARVRYATIVYNTSLDNLTLLSSHEAMEAVLDPDPNSSWTEIGDLCQTLSPRGTRIDGVLIERPYSNSECGCGSMLNWPDLAGYLVADSTSAPANGTLAVATDAPNANRLQVFGIGGDHAVWHKSEIATAPFWGDWSSLGGWVSKIATGVNADGRIELFGIGSDNALYHLWETSANNFSGWTNLGLTFHVYDIASNRNKANVLAVYGVEYNHKVFESHEDATQTGGWSQWLPLRNEDGITATQVAAGRNSDGRAEIFAVGVDGVLYHVWQDTTGAWSHWGTMGLSNVRQVVTGHTPVASGNRLAVFALTTDGKAWRNILGNGWSGWIQMNLEPGIVQITVANNGEGGAGNGRMELFGYNGNGNVSHTWQLDNDDTHWSGVGYRGGNVSQIAVGQNGDGRVELFAIDPSSHKLIHDWQTGGNPIWFY